jgi:hypothetical protein
MKRMAMFVLALALAMTAMVTAPAETAQCLEPACFASPGCCYNWQCDDWCNAKGAGYCQGATPQFGGCCVCVA